MSFQIITDSSWDMGTEKAEQLHIDVIPFFVAKDGEQYEKEVVELPVRELYQFMVDHPGVYPKTAQPSIEEYINRFRSCLQQGQDVICCCVNQKFSGSYNAAALAKQMVEEEYEGDAHIEIIDTTQATLMQGLIVQELAYARDGGVSFEDTVIIARKLSESARIFFTVSGMDYLIHGGRVGKLAGTAANVLNICPMICLSDGELHSAGLVRGRKKARKKALDMLIGYIKELGFGPEHFHYIVGYGYDVAEGAIMQEMIQEALHRNWPEFETQVEAGQIGAAIGVHTGPHPIGFGIVERYETLLKNM